MATTDGDDEDDDPSQTEEMNRMSQQ